MTTRRDLLARLAGAAAVAALPAPLRAALASPGRPDSPQPARTPLGVQLYTVRELLKRDPAATLALVADAGYREVEFAGYHDVPPARWRAMLDQLGLRAPAAHVGLADLTDGLDRALEQATVLGHRWLALAWVDPKGYPDRAAWQRLADTLNQAGERALDAGVRIAFHNNVGAMDAIGGTRPLDLLLEHTDPDLVDFELDVYWMIRGGGSPRDYCVDWPGRFALAHLKDTAGPPDHAQRDVGAGALDWRFLLNFLRRPGGLRHAFVEHDEPTDAVASIRASAAYLRTLDR